MVRKGLYGDKAKSVTMKIGDRVEALADASGLSMKFSKNGKVVKEIPITTGKSGFETRNGTKVVLGRESFVRMRSGSVGIGGGESYDLGVHWIPSDINVNNRFALPNKFFDYVQARIGIAIGPSEEMARELREYGLGVVARSFEEPDLAASLLPLDAAQLNEFKDHAGVAARELNFEAQAGPVRSALRELLGT